MTAANTFVQFLLILHSRAQLQCTLAIDRRWLCDKGWSGEILYRLCLLSSSFTGKEVWFFAGQLLEQRRNRKGSFLWEENFHGLLQHAWFAKICTLKSRLFYIIVRCLKMSSQVSIKHTYCKSSCISLQFLTLHTIMFAFVAFRDLFVAKTCWSN